MKEEETAWLMRACARQLGARGCGECGARRENNMAKPVKGPQADALG